jgi:hypothetical protein
MLISSARKANLQREVRVEASGKGSGMAKSCGTLGRRRFLQGVASGVLAYAAAGAQPLTADPAAAPREVFKTRGYYLCLPRLPDFGLPEWKTIIDSIKQDRGNYLILWMGGGFRSRKFPITWQYNRDHLNIQHDFVRALIDYAHSLGIKVVLGFTPFGYDGVNQYPLAHPELKATQPDGTLYRLWGIHSWGYILCPSQAESQRFILEYASELYFDFYPNADGIMIESSDYGVCYCPRCRGHYYEREFKFVEAVSERVWRKSPAAEIVVYPQYFVAAGKPGSEEALPAKYDPRWTLFFTFHSTPLVKDLVKAAPHSLQYEALPYLAADGVQTAIRKMRDFGVNGITPSLECFSFRARYPEGNYWQTMGRKYKPFGYEWLRPGQNPYQAVLTRVWRTAFREFAANPDLPWDDFRAALQRDLFAASTPAAAADDLLEWQKIYLADPSWWAPSPILSPEFFRWRLELGQIKPAQLEDYRAMLGRLRQIRAKYRSPSRDANLQELLDALDYVRAQWTGHEDMLNTPPPQGPSTG